MKNIEIQGLTKRYKNGVTALEDVSFSAGGGVFGLLGHNGAGKSTLMRILVTVLAPSAGTVRVCGFDARTQGDQVRGQIGYLPQELTMYSSLTVFEFVRYMAELKGVRDRGAAAAALEQVEMEQFAKRRIGQLSGGMRRRVGIAQALVGTPQILVVDEPTAGLDPEERVRFRGVLSQYAREGRTVILSTHIVEDVHQICGELAVLRGGRLFYAGTPEALTDKVAGRVKLLRLSGDAELLEVRKKAVVLSTTYEERGISARVVDMHTMKPLDEALVLKAAEETGCIVTTEEANVLGGLGAAVCEYLSGEYPVPVVRHGVMDEFGRSGKAPLVLEAYGITPEEIAKSAKKAMAMKK